LVRKESRNPDLYLKIVRIKCKFKI
jgi:hypothetical protein